MVKRIPLAIAAAVVDVLATIWRHRAGLLELLGAGCLVVAATVPAQWLAWAVAGVLAEVKAADIERQARRA